MEIDPTPFAAVARLLHPQAALERAWPLVGGISAEMTAVAFRTPDGRSQTVIVRVPVPWPEGVAAAQREFTLLAALHAAGLLVPNPRLLDDSRGILPQPYLVLDYVAGAPIYATTDIDDYAQQLAAELARLHNLDPAASALRDLPRLAPRLDRWIFHDDAPPDASIGQERVLAALRPVWPLPTANPPALLHGDLWAGNVVWHNGRLAAIIDWEEAMVGEPLYDVAALRLDLLWAFGWPMTAAFTAAYAARRAIDLGQLPWWDLVVAMRPANELSYWAAVWPQVGRPEVTPATMRRDLGEFVARALGAVG